MSQRYVENPSGSQFNYDVVNEQDNEDGVAEFRRVRIEHGWVPENPSDEESILINKVASESIAASA